PSRRRSAWGRSPRRTCGSKRRSSRSRRPRSSAAASCSTSPSRRPGPATRPRPRPEAPANRAGSGSAVSARRASATRFLIGFLRETLFSPVGGTTMKRALTAAALLGGLWLLAPAAQAQTGTARGKVLDAQGQPLADAKGVMEFQGGTTPKFGVKSNKKGDQPSLIEVRISLGDPTPVPDFKLNTMAEAQKQAAGGSDAAALRGSFQ